MPPRKTKKTAKSKAAKPPAKAAKPARRAKKQAPARKAAKPAAKRPAPPEADESQEQTEPLLLEPIPDDAVVKHVVPLLEVDGLVQLMACAKTICARLGAAGTPESTAALRVVGRAYGVAIPADADVLDWSKRLFRWTRHQEVSDELDLDLAKALSCGTVPHGCEDELFFEPRPADYEPKEGDIYSIASGLAASATWLVCKKKFGPRYFDDEEEDIVFKDLRVGEEVDLSAFDSDERDQGVHSRVRLNDRVTADFEVEMNYGADDGATIDWSLRVEIRAAGGRPSKRSQQAEGLAHWSDFGFNATFGEVLWCGRATYGDAQDGPPDGREIHRA